MNKSTHWFYSISDKEVFCHTCHAIREKNFAHTEKKWTTLDSFNTEIQRPSSIDLFLPDSQEEI